MATYDRGRGLTLTRMFDAPPEMVFDAWTDPASLDWFYNPNNLVTEPLSVDLRVGGAWRQLMVENAGKQYFTGGIYREIVPAEKLVFSWGAVGGWPDLDPDRLEDSPLVTVLFKPVGAGTEMVFRVQLADHLTEDRVTEWMNCGMVEGWNITIDRMLPDRRRKAA
jgi:uncharacterized protein YndB with AHSA1/START domain